MSPVRSNPAPLPVALLALSVVVCVTASASAGPMNSTGPMSTPGSVRPATVDQRDALEHLLAALTDAARKLGERLDHQALINVLGPLPQQDSACVEQRFDPTAAPATTHLRDALLNLPPPAGR